MTRGVYEPAGSGQRRPSRCLYSAFNQDDETRMPFDQGCDVSVLAACQQIALPVTGDGAIFDLRWPLADASKKFNQFEAKLPEHVREGLSKFLNTGRKNRDVICAFWPMGWTNADIECQNGIIKKIERAAGGSLEYEELRRQWIYGRSMSAILGREKERVPGKKNGPQKKSILELSKMPPPEPVPIEGKGGQLSLFG